VRGVEDLDVDQADAAAGELQLDAVTVPGTSSTSSTSGAVSAVDAGTVRSKE